MEKKPPAYFSPSRLSTYDRCPQLFFERYILKLPQPPAAERMFGTAIHCGIEAHFRGQDHELAYLQSWRTSARECKQSGVFVPDLTARGLELIDMVISLGLAGDPEQEILTLIAGIPLPLYGIADLISPGRIIDFKTTQFGWTQDRADRELWQPAIYSQAYAEAHDGEYPRFEFVVLPRAFGPLQRFDGTRTPGQIFETFERARAIYNAIEAKQFECRGSSCWAHRDRSTAA
jgi:hypothetical protein